jgi:hypothetical protein
LTEGECLNQAGKCMNRVQDEFDTFGEFVATELRSLTSVTLRKMMKSDFMQVMTRYAELDLNFEATCYTKVTRFNVVAQIKIIYEKHNVFCNFNVPSSQVHFINFLSSLHFTSDVP